MYQDGKARIEIISRGKSTRGCPMLLSTIQFIIGRSIVLHKNNIDYYDWIFGLQEKLTREDLLSWGGGGVTKSLRSRNQSTIHPFPKIIFKPILIFLIIFWPF
jgi:hypothetical protein